MKIDVYEIKALILVKKKAILVLAPGIRKPN